MWEIFEILCAKKSVTTADVCKATGIAQSTMSNWKKRRNRINVKHGQRIADYFDVSLQYLMTGEDVHQNPVSAQNVQNRDFYVNNDDVQYIVETVSKWSEDQKKRLRRYVEDVDRIIGGEA